MRGRTTGRRARLAAFLVAAALIPGAAGGATMAAPTSAHLRVAGGSGWSFDDPRPAPTVRSGDEGADTEVRGGRPAHGTRPRKGRPRPSSPAPPGRRRPAAGPADPRPTRPTPRFELRWLPMCGYAGSRVDGEGCGAAYAYCRRHEPGTPGPLGLVQRREVPPDGPPGSWRTVSRTCLGRVPPTAGQGPPAPNPPPSPEQIARLWRHTPFSRAVPALQPPNGVTLVGLPTFVAATWSAAGYGPREIEHHVLLGHDVRIRPSSARYVYVFGDGTTLGPTPSPGGPWPHGRIRHSYPRSGVYDLRIDALYAGHASVDGGPWRPIGAEVLVRGGPVRLTVAQALNRLMPPG